MFISKCRNELTVFGAGINWDDMVWPDQMVFSKLGVTNRRPAEGDLMNPEFVPFAKAYFRYQQGHTPTRTRNESKALRAIEAALRENTGSADISQLSITVLDLAAQLGVEHYSDGAAYQCAREIERLATFVTENRLVPNFLKGWRSPVRRPDDKNKTGKKGVEERQSKLPDQVALDALAEIFSNDPIDQRDIFTTSVFALLMCSPARISEVLALPVDCEVMVPNEHGDLQYAWRFYSAKGFEGYIKDIPTVMVPIAKEAVKRLTHQSAGAREFAKWVEDNPTRFYRHPNCPDVGDDVPLSMSQAAQALGLAYHSQKNARTSLHNRGLEQDDGVHTLNSLWLHVLNRLPRNFPWFDKERRLKFSRALCVLNQNQLSAGCSAIPVSLQQPTNNLFNNDLSPRYSLGSAHESIFDRYGYKNEQGERLAIRSHQVRHLLNTICERGGLSQDDIAKWSGRADKKQNRTYNGMSEYEILDELKKIDPNKNLFGPLGEVSKHWPVTSQEFNTLEHAAVHVTEYGYCIHDYLIEPCRKNRDCIHCNEQICIKGNKENLHRLKLRLERNKQLFARAQQDVENGYSAVDSWYQYHEKTVFLLTELVEILENDEIPDGSPIRLKGRNFSQLRRVIDKKEIQVTDIKNDEQLQLEDVRKLLGGAFG